jgi:hypothetical protein
MLEEMAWAIDVAVEVAKVDKQSLLSRRRWRPIPEVWRGIYWFYKKQEWSSLALSGALGHDAGGIRHALRKGAPEPGQMSFRVYHALAKAWVKRAAMAQARAEKMNSKALEMHARELASRREEELRYLREEEQFLESERAQRQVAIAGSLIRVQPPDGKNTVAIEIKHKGRKMPTRRVHKEEAGPLEPGCFRVESVPPFLGGVILVPVPEAEWRGE